MDRYQRVEKPRPESTINENEIRITAQGVIRNYISYASTLLQVVFLYNILFFLLPFDHYVVDSLFPGNLSCFYFMGSVFSQNFSLFMCVECVYLTWILVFFLMVG